MLQIISLGFGNPGRWDDQLAIDVLVSEMNETELAGQVLMLGYEGGYPTQEFIEFVQTLNEHTVDTTSGSVKVWALHNLGMIYQDQGEYKKAGEKYNESLNIYKELEDKRSIASILHQLGNSNIFIVNKSYCTINYFS